MDLQQEQSINSTTSTDAMSLDFFSLPSEVRNTIYELVLLRDRPVNPRRKHGRQESLTPGLLRTNKAVVHQEATSLLYAQNRFELIAAQERILDFFNGIGETNASYIRHVQIEFLHLARPHEELISNFAVFATIQRHCARLETVRLCRMSVRYLRKRLAYRGALKLGKEFKVVNDCFRASTCFKEVAVEVDRGLVAPGEDLERLFEEYGWREIVVKDRDRPRRIAIKRR